MKFNFNLQAFFFVALLRFVGFVHGRDFFPEDGRGFLSAGCTDWWGDENNVWRAMCPDGVCGTMVESFLDLNHCITNKNGNLYWNASGTFGDTCRDCFISGDRFLACKCHVDQSNTLEEHMAVIDLNEGILANYWGYLTCFGIIDAGRATHKWPCKPDDWVPWGKGSEKLASGKFANDTVHAPKIAPPPKTMFPEHQFVVPNATVASNASLATVTATPAARSTSATLVDN